MSNEAYTNRFLEKTNEKMSTQWFQKIRNLSMLILLSIGTIGCASTNYAEVENRTSNGDKISEKEQLSQEDIGKKLEALRLKANQIMNQETYKEGYKNIEIIENIYEKIIICIWKVKHWWGFFKKEAEEDFKIIKKELANINQ